MGSKKLREKGSQVMGIGGQGMSCLNNSTSYSQTPTRHSESNSAILVSFRSEKQKKHVNSACILCLREINYRVDSGRHCIQVDKNIYDCWNCRSHRLDKPYRTEIRKPEADPSTGRLPGKLIWHYYPSDGDLHGNRELCLLPKYV